MRGVFVFLMFPRCWADRGVTSSQSKWHLISLTVTGFFGRSLVIVGLVPGAKLHHTGEEITCSSRDQYLTYILRIMTPADRFPYTLV